MYAVAFVLVSLIVSASAIIVTAIVRDDEFSAQDFFDTVLRRNRNS
jgi:hypothetical protein